jgi:hypothetical protein
LVDERLELEIVIEDFTGMRIINLEKSDGYFLKGVKKT